MALDIEALLQRKRRNTAECPIAIDPDAIEAHTRALADCEAARAVAADNPERASARTALAEAEERLEAAERAADEATIVFRFRGLSDEEWDLLIDEHQPTPDQVHRARKKGETPPDWNPDTFPAALVAACCTDPGLTLDQAQAMWKSPDWNGAELSAIFNGAFTASRMRRVPQLGKGSGRTLS